MTSFVNFQTKDETRDCGSSQKYFANFANTKTASFYWPLGTYQLLHMEIKCLKQDGLKSLNGIPRQMAVFSDRLIIQKSQNLSGNYD